MARSGSRRALSLGLRAAVIAVVLGGLYYFLRGLDPAALGRAMAGASPWLVLAAAAVNLGQVWFRGLRLREMLAHLRRIPLSHLVRYNFASYAANNLLPGRAGEVVAVYLLKAREGIPVSVAISVSVLDKAFEALGLVLLALPLPFALGGLPRWARISLWALAAIALVLLGAAAVVARRFGEGGAASRSAPGPTGEAKPAGSLAARIAAGSEVARRPAVFARTLLWSLLTHLTDAAAALLVLRAVGFHQHPLAAPILVMVAVSLALAVPSTPSGLGAFEMAAVAALGLLGVPAANALAFAVLYHLVQIVPVTLLGLGGLRYVAEARAAGASIADGSRSGAAG